MTCTRGAASPDAHTQRRLFAASAGYCQNPTCANALFVDVANKSIHIAEMAHVFAANNGGPRANPQLSEAERGAFENLVVLCSNCHTMVDKAPGTGLKYDGDAARVEDALTIQIMGHFGRQNVRGGKYCMLDQAEIDAALVRQGQWEIVERAAMSRRSFELQEQWDAALDNILVIALEYYQSPSLDLREKFFAAMYGLTQYRFWHSDFDAALDTTFWDEKGILPVLLSFRDDRPVASNCQDAFCVLGGAMSRTRRNGPPFHHIFLFAWTAFVPSCTTAQESRIDQWRRALSDERDRRYDDFTSILLPKMRYLLRG
jgi:hypothetical protein